MYRTKIRGSTSSDHDYDGDPSGGRLAEVEDRRHLTGDRRGDADVAAVPQGS